MIRPTGDKVLIEVDGQEKKTAGGLFLPVSSVVSKTTGTVRAVGDSEVITVKPGDRVIFVRGMGHRFQEPYTVKSGVGFSYTEYRAMLLIGFYDIEAVVTE
jgi:chaperonin GroES